MLRISLLFVLFLPLIMVSQNSCFEIKSILVDACGSPEGPNEMVRIQIGNNPLNTIDFQANWPNNPFRGLCQNASTANNVAYMNSTIQSCGYFLEPQNGVLPANTQVLIITSEDFDATAHDYSGLMDTVYVIFQCSGNTAGHFANWVNGCDPGGGNRTTTISFGAGCAQTKTYNRCLLINQNGGVGGNAAIRDGARADFGSNNTVAYANDGCTIPIGIFSVNANLNAGQLPACPNDTINVVAQVSGISSNNQWSSAFGSFSNSSNLSTNYIINSSLDHYIYFQAVDGCGIVKLDSIYITVNEAPNLTLNVVELNSDCGPGSIAIEANTSQNVLWNTGETTSQIIPQSNGYYIATVSNDCGTLSDSVFIDFQANFDFFYDFADTICQYSEGNVFEIEIIGESGAFILDYTLNGVSNNLSFNENGQINLPSSTAGNNSLVLSSLENQLENCILFLSDTLYYYVLPHIELINLPDEIAFCQGENAFVHINTNSISSAYLNYELIGPSEIISDSLLGTGTFSIPVSTLEPGDFVLNLKNTGYNNFGCNRNLNENILITIHSSPSGSIYGDTSICRDTKGVFFTLSTDSEFIPLIYHYTINGEEYSFTGENPTSEIPFETHNSGEYTVVLDQIESIETGCKSMLENSILINVVAPPLIDFLVNPLELFDDFTTPQFMNFTDGDNQFYWDFGDGNGSFEKSPWHSYSPEGEAIFQVTLYASNYLGCEDSAFTTIKYVIHDIIYVPNSFSPDGNNFNEIFIPVLNGRFDKYNYSMSIFNRWGEVVFMSQNPNVGWDGRYNGEKAPDGVYIWRIDVGLDYIDTTITKTGHVTLLR